MPSCPYPKNLFKHRPASEWAEIARYAALTTSTIAARKYGCSDVRIRVWMAKLGIPRRRAGNLSNADIAAIKQCA